MLLIIIAIMAFLEGVLKASHIVPMAVIKIWMVMAAVPSPVADYHCCSSRSNGGGGGWLAIMPSRKQ